MDFNFLNSFSLVPIPSEFYSDLEEKPFCNCTFCSKELLGADEPYLVEKSYKVNPNNKQKNTIFEYAICMDCNKRKMNALSKESIQNIQNYMQENFKIENLEEGEEESEYLSKCIVTGTPQAELEEYNIVGQFIGNHMVEGQFPLLVGASVGEDLQGLLSEKTKEEFDDFMDTITGVPPELKELFKSKRPVLV